MVQVGLTDKVDSWNLVPFRAFKPTRTKTKMTNTLLTISSISEHHGAIAGLALLSDGVNLNVAALIGDLALLKKALENLVSGRGGQA